MGHFSVDLIAPIRELGKATDAGKRRITRGLRYGPPADVMAGVAKRKLVDPGKYYFRRYMTFETASKKYA